MTFGFNWDNTIESAEIAPGTVGLLMDDTPPLNHSRVKPFVWAIALACGAVRHSEVLACVTPICSVEDLKSGYLEEEGDDRSLAEWLIDEILGDMTAAGLLEYNIEKGFWTLRRGKNNCNLPTIIKAVAGVDGALPRHLTIDLR